MGKLTSDDLKGHLALGDRNSYSNDPITRNQVKQLLSKLDGLWEDTSLVTYPNAYLIVTVGNLQAILRTLLYGRGLVEETKDGERHAQDQLPMHRESRA